MNFVVSIFNISILNSLGSIIACNYHDRNHSEAHFCFKCPFKSAHYFNYNSINLLRLKITLLNFRLSIFFLKFHGIKVTSLPVSTFM